MTEIYDGAPDGCPPDRFSLAVLCISKNDVKTTSICHKLKRLPYSNQNGKIFTTVRLIRRVKSEIRVLKTCPLNPFSFRFKFIREISSKMLVSFSS